MDRAESDRSLRARYDAIWDAAVSDVSRGHATLDPLAFRKAEDARRGLTLLARPAPDVVAALTTWLHEIRVLEPEQYVQPPDDLHHTVLSLFTATPEHASSMDRLPLYRDAVAEALVGVGPFEIELRGVTLSTGAILAQGFPRGPTLANLRDRLRASLRKRELTAGLDARYRLVTAHMTLVRFAAPLRDPEALIAMLGASREREFGTTCVDRLELVFGDWYQSSDRSSTLNRLDLESGR